MEPRIEKLLAKKLIGKSCQMSFSDNKTKELWQRFMLQRNKIKHNIGPELYSAEVYDPLFFKNFNPAKEFEKWAAVEVTDFNSIPDGMQTLTFPSGLYAVFLHKGPAATAPQTYQYIFNTWIPNSEFLIDDRPHFAVMGENYNPNSRDSEEEIWIPITKSK